MKVRTTAITLLACSLLLTGCTDRQMQGTMMGSSLGAIFGSSVGGLMGGPRGSDAGTAIGMAVGAVIGNAATAPGQQKQSRQTQRDAADDDRYSSPSTGSSDVTAAPGSDAAGNASSHIEGLRVENIRFIDENRNQTIDAGEKAKLIFEIHNDGSDTLYNITPVISCDCPKYIQISPTAIIANLLPGKAVVYTANILAADRLRSSTVNFRLAFQDGKRRVTFKDFSLSTRGK